MKDIQHIKQQFGEMDQRLLQAEKELKEFAKFKKRYNEIAQNMKVLQAFYHSGEWLNGRDILHDHLAEDEYYYCAGEDSIWNVTQDFYNEKVKLLKQLAKDL